MLRARLEHADLPACGRALYREPLHSGPQRGLVGEIVLRSWEYRPEVLYH